MHYCVLGDCVPVACFFVRVCTCVWVCLPNYIREKITTKKKLKINSEENYSHSVSSTFQVFQYICMFQTMRYGNNAVYDTGSIIVCHSLWRVRPSLTVLLFTCLYYKTTHVFPENIFFAMTQLRNRYKCTIRTWKSLHQQRSSIISMYFSLYSVIMVTILSALLNEVYFYIGGKISRGFCHHYYMLTTSRQLCI